MNKSLFLFLVALLIAAGIYVSKMKYEVVFMRNRLKEADAKMEKAADDLQVSKAEWAYLTDPRRIKNLTDKYLKEHANENNVVLTYDDVMNGDFLKKQPEQPANDSEPKVNTPPRKGQRNPAKKQNRKKAFDTFLDGALKNSGGASGG